MKINKLNYVKRKRKYLKSRKLFQKIFLLFCYFVMNRTYFTGLINDTFLLFFVLQEMDTPTGSSLEASPLRHLHQTCRTGWTSITKRCRNSRAVPNTVANLMRLCRRKVASHRAEATVTKKRKLIRGIPSWKTAVAWEVCWTLNDCKHLDLTLNSWSLAVPSLIQVRKWYLDKCIWYICSFSLSIIVALDRTVSSFLCPAMCVYFIAICFLYWFHCSVVSYAAVWVT